MYLRVENGETKQVYAFEHKKAVKIGRSQTCDIQLVSEGISRYHVEIHEIDGGFEVVDLGSTNGTYINEERLMPNQATSFNTFFPLKLGHSVYVYLIDSDENQEKVNILNDVLPSGNKENAAEEQETAIHKF